ncbi:serine/threonine protein kinase [Streptomyces sp. N2-109]|uniref:non-specific serine/threonine protein kinase n=1 Tax=Streptomyces gossypii TaxID=2883101 RepID=A0ABT2JUF6_9ACTN|nr:serine/threonine-protein kinase [Streptomyces gossypii]MCT2591303.1 serine/threonine protein kinase [Streptomyces gossypii]
MARKIGSRYTAHQILGRGSAGTVWLGEGPEGPVAIKLLREDLSSDQELVDRFVQERAALLSLDHPRVVGLRELVVDGSDLALVMDLVRGTDLRTRLEHERRLAPQAAVAIATDIADGLVAAHAAGIIHRDVKPENVLLDAHAPPGPGGAPPALLTDFGIAKLIDSPRRAAALRNSGGAGPSQAAQGLGGQAFSSGSQGLQGPRGIIGTPDYLAPELVEGLPPRAAVDIYALATVLYELLAGFTPFGGGHPGAILRRHVTERVAPLPGIPDELWQLIHQCLAKAPASRLRAPEMAARLREILPELEGAPPLEIDEQPDEPYDEPPPGRSATGTVPAAAPAQDVPPRVAVPLVETSTGPESNRDTHTSMRVPGADELAGGAHGTARAPRATGARRAGSARNRAAQAAALRKRRVRLGVVAAVIAVAAGLGGWLATSGDDSSSRPAPEVQQSTNP